MNARLPLPDWIIFPLALLGAPALLGGCAQGDMGDLARFVQDVKARQKPEVPPLPKMKPYESFLYAAIDLRDPFTPAAEGEAAGDVAQAQSAIRPDESRRKEALEAYPLDSLRMVGTLAQEGQLWGIVKAPDGAVYRVEKGNHMGQNYGKIARVGEDKILLDELIPNGQGGWQERQASLALAE